MVSSAAVKRAGGIPTGSNFAWPIIQSDNQRQILTGRLRPGWVANKHRPGKTQLIDQKKLDRIIIRSGHPGMTTKTIEYLVRGSGSLEITYSTEHGGTVSTTVRVG